MSILTTVELLVALVANVVMFIILRKEFMNIISPRRAATDHENPVAESIGEEWIIHQRIERRTFEEVLREVYPCLSEKEKGDIAFLSQEDPCGVATARWYLRGHVEDFDAILRRVHKESAARIYREKLPRRA